MWHHSRKVFKEPRKLYTAYHLSFHVHVKRKCYRYSKRIGFLIQKIFPRLNVRFNRQLTQSKSFLEDHKKWTVEKSTKWIQLKLTALTTIVSNKGFIWLIDWLSWKTKLQWFDRRTCGRRSVFPIGINEHVLCQYWSTFSFSKF